MTRRILTFALFESQSILSEEQVKFLDKYTKGKWLLNPSNGLVDVDGYIDFRGKKLVDMKGIRFGSVRGNFSCSDNNLTSLEGAPQEVGGYFNCSGNELISLEGAPQKVGGGFYCHTTSLPLSREHHRRLEEVLTVQRTISPLSRKHPTRLEEISAVQRIILHLSREHHKR